MYNLTSLIYNLTALIYFIIWLLWCLTTWLDHYTYLFLTALFHHFYVYIWLFCTFIFDLFVCLSFTWKLPVLCLLQPLRLPPYAGPYQIMTCRRRSVHASVSLRRTDTLLHQGAWREHGTQVPRVPWAAQCQVKEAQVSAHMIKAVYCSLGFHFVMHKNVKLYFLEKVWIIFLSL
jgi:hypothetical protein